MGIVPSHEVHGASHAPRLREIVASPRIILGNVSLISFDLVIVRGFCLKLHVRLPHGDGGKVSGRAAVGLLSQGYNPRWRT